MNSVVLHLYLVKAAVVGHIYVPGVTLHALSAGDHEQGCLPVTSQQRITLWSAVMLAVSAALFWGWKLYQMRLKWELARIVKA
jgi:hypothetical protein